MNTKRLSLCLLLCLVLLVGLCASAAAEAETIKLCGRDYPLDAESVDLRSMGSGEGEANAAMLALLPELKTVELGEEREGGPDWEDILALRQAAPQAEFHYAFTLYGKDFSLEDTEMDLNHIPIHDGGELVKRVLRCMPRLSWLCMDSCEVSNTDMAAIRDEFPQVEVVWRIWFGWCYSVRTNVEKILASNPGYLFSEELDEEICYCSKLKYLDLGHNVTLRDAEFLRGTPEMEVLILAITHLKDLSPLAECPKLEYLEIFQTEISDLSPLKDLKNLRHLNMGSCPYLRDMTPIMDLELERLYIGAGSKIPQEQIDEYKQRHPDCFVDDYSYDSSLGEWRYTARFDDDPDYMAKDYYRPNYHPRYALLVQQFGYKGPDYSDYSYSWLDPNI